MHDVRREIHEEDDEQAECSTQAFLIHDGELPLGKHFHRNKTEVFFILSGTLKKLTITDEEGNNPLQWEDLPAGTMIIMPPRVAHTFFFEPGSTMICYATERFDSTDMPAPGRKIERLEAPVELESSRRAPRH
jgi:mannose-6-phosphate isomerase-like protein (cupin superfamily)